MLIVSSFRDFYDSALAYGIDKTVIYNRQSEDHNSIFKIPPITWNPTTKHAVIGFCGILYRYTEIYEEDYIPKKGYQFKKHNLYNEWPEPNFFQKHYKSEWIGHGKEDIDLFIKLKTPIFIDTGKNLTTNICLKEYSFMKIFDPFQANQKIQQFLTNELAQEKMPISKQTDKEKVAAHGFDKFSFRKQK